MSDNPFRGISPEIDKQIDEATAIKPIKWPKYRTTLPPTINHLSKIDFRVNKIVIKGLENRDSTIQIMDDVIDLLNDQRLAMHRKLKEVQGS